MNAPAHIASAEAAEAADRGARTRHLAPAYRQLFGFLLTLVVVIVILGAWSYAQELEKDHPTARLYGELLFLGLVIWWGLAAISPWLSRGTRFVNKAIEVPPISNLQALVWAAAIVVAVPIAIQHGRLGLAIPIAVSTVCVAGLPRAGRRWDKIPHAAPLCFSCVVGAFALVPVAMLTEANRLGEPKIAGAMQPVYYADALAEDLRPLLFFDKGERYPPVDVDEAVKKVCKNGATEGGCGDSTKRLTELSDGEYVRVISSALAPGQKPGGPASAIYHHVFQQGTTVYVDYWWYYAHNPAPVARSVLCGRALTRGLLGKGCAEHPADWEGITLVLVPATCRLTSPENSCVTHDRKPYKITEAHYAQHEKVVVYEWTRLQQRWKGLRQAQGAGHRPLVFVALSSHASYAEPCNRAWCPQIVHKTFSERRNGLAGWTNNHACVDDCVKELPTKGDGSPDGWNAVRARWGAQTCILFGSYCDTQLAPMAPAFQDRYKDPCPAAHCIIPGPSLNGE